VRESFTHPARYTIPAADATDRQTMKLKRPGAVSLGIALSGIFLWVAFRGISYSTVLSHLRAADPILLGLAILNHTLGIHIRALRWKYLLAPVTREEIPFGARVSATAVGVAANNVMPLRVGEFARVLVLARQCRTGVPVILGTVVIERLLDALVTVATVFAIMALASFPPVGAIGGTSPAAAARGVLVVAGSVGIVLMLLAVFPLRSVRLAERAARFLPATWRRPLVDSLQSFLKGLGVLQSPRYLALSLLWATAQWAFLALGFYLGLRAFDIAGPGYVGAVFLQAMVGFAVAIPSTPGFFGPWEAAGRFTLGLWGIDEARAVSFAVSFHTGSYLLMTALGAFHLWLLGLHWRDVRTSPVAVEEAVERDLDAKNESMSDRGG
jgi:hypothetical protein